METAKTLNIVLKMYFMLSPSSGDPEIVAVQGLCIDHRQLSIHLVMNFKSISVNAALNQQYNNTQNRNAQ